MSSTTDEARTHYTLSVDGVNRLRELVRTEKQRRLTLLVNLFCPTCVVMVVNSIMNPQSAWVCLPIAGIQVVGFCAAWFYLSKRDKGEKQTT